MAGGLNQVQRGKLERSLVGATYAPVTVVPSSKNIHILHARSCPLGTSESRESGESRSRESRQNRKYRRIQRIEESKNPQNCQKRQNCQHCQNRGN